MIIEQVATFLKTCPLLKKGRLCVDFLGFNPVEYTLDTIPDTKIIKEYSDGGSLRQFTFIFASREPYGNDKLLNIKNSGFYEKFSDWLDDCTKTKNLPKLSKGLVAQSICAQSLGYMFEGGADTARYQIQCRLIYYKQAN